MQAHDNGQAGFSLIETMIAILVLTVGAVGMAGVFLSGMSTATSGPNELLATQKAAEAIESVFAARDSQTATWAQLRNVAEGGIFLDGPQPMKVAGADGILDTADDGAVESVALPGPDQLMGTGDDKTQTLAEFTREIRITEVSVQLRTITVTITYPSAGRTRSYSVTSYISAFS